MQVGVEICGNSLRGHDTQVSVDHGRYPGRVKGSSLVRMLWRFSGPKTKNEFTGLAGGKHRFPNSVWQYDLGKMRLRIEVVLTRLIDDP